MQITGKSGAPIDRTELPSMLATLCSYESRFGPYHPHTLHLMTYVGITYWQVGDPNRARPLLERAVRELGAHVNLADDLRLRAIGTLRDLFAAQGDQERAASAEKELLRCQIQRLGDNHTETRATHADLTTLSN